MTRDTNQTDKRPPHVRDEEHEITDEAALLIGTLISSEARLIEHFDTVMEDFTLEELNETNVMEAMAAHVDYAGELLAEAPTGALEGAAEFFDQVAGSRLRETWILDSSLYLPQVLDELDRRGQHDPVERPSEHDVQ